MHNNTPSKAIVNAVANITYMPLIEADDKAVNKDRKYRGQYFNNLTHFWDTVDIVYVMYFSDVTLLFEQLIIFTNLQFILLFLNI